MVQSDSLFLAMHDDLGDASKSTSDVRCETALALQAVDDAYFGQLPCDMSRRYPTKDNSCQGTSIECIGRFIPLDREDVNMELDHR
jgi:hypothetical protein